MTIYLVLDATNEPVNAFYAKDKAMAYAEAHAGCRVMMIMVKR